MREYSKILGPVDSAFYYVERLETPMNIGALTIFDGAIDFDELVEHVECHLHEIPRYRERIIQAPLNLGQPTWVPDPDFFIGNHIKRARVEPPGDEVQLRKLTAELLSQTLDRRKPLWEIHVIEGLPDQTAVVFKVHHCMVDGLAAVELFTFLMDVNQDIHPEPSVTEFHPLFDPLPLPEPLELTVDSLVRDLSHQFGLLQKLGRETLRLGAALTDRDKRLKMLLALAHMLNNNLRPIQKLPINGRNGGLQNVVWAEFPLDEVHSIRAQCGASVNDVMLALLTKAVERYTADRGGTGQSFLRVLIPVNVREQMEKGDYGNRISVLPVDIPFNIADPMEHLKATTRFTTVMKESSLAFTMDLVLTLPSLLPAVTHLPVWNLAPVAFSLLAHTWCTNVAAMPVPVYMMGHELKHVYGYFPLNPSMGLASVIVSYNGRITLTLITDQAIVKDSSVLQRYIKEAYYDLANGLPERKPLEIPQPVSIPAPAAEVISRNGASANGIKGDISTGQPTVIVTVPVEQPATLFSSQAHRLFSDGWAKALQEELNQSESYRSVSLNWTAGSLALVMEAAPDHGFESPAAVWLDLYRGICRSAHALSPQDAMRDAAFVIQGSYICWMDVLSGKAAPLVMLTNGRLKLRKGALLRLLPHTRSAGELVRCAQRVPYIKESVPEV